MNTFQLKNFSFLIFLFLAFALKAQVIPDSLRVDWSNAGYPGTIPAPALIINVKDFGAYGDSIHDDYNAIEGAINSSSDLRVIYFPAGIYLIKSTITLPSNVVLRGEGSANTNLCFDLTGGNCIDVGSAQLNLFSNIDSGYSKGSNVINISNTSMFKAGSYAEIEETNGSWDVVPASWAKNCVGQLVNIKSVADKSISIEPSLRIDYLRNLQPQIRLLVPVQNAGIECLKITRADSMPNNYGYNIRFLYAENCWVTGIESNISQGSHVMLNASGHITISGCYFHDAFTYDGTGTAGYGVTLIQHSSDCKIENCVFRHLRHSMIAKQGANGNVFAYNYSFDPNRTEIPNDAGGDLLLHGHYAFANLFEGNIGQNIIIDQSWGPSGPYNTFFRNRADLYGIAIIDTTAASVKENYVGNEVTNSGNESGYPLGNYVLSANQFTYANNITGSIQPPGTNTLDDKSYFLNKQPYYWNIASSWPSIGVPNAISSGSNPAKERYLSGGIKTSCISKPASLTVIATADSIVCNGAATTITVHASGGVAPYQYSIDGIHFQSQNTFIKSADSYLITAIDAGADSATTGISFSEPTIIKASLKKVNLTCYGDSAGSITVTASGGIKPYQYNINSGIYQSSNVFKNLKAGTYNVAVKDAGGCVLNVPSTSITQPSAISITTSIQNASCKNASDGAITITASKGAGMYQYSLNGGAYQSSNIFNGLPAGSYTVKVQDQKGCIALKSSINIKNLTKACNKTFSFKIAKRFDVLVYPNPATTAFSLTINSSSQTDVDIRLTDIYGRKIYETSGPVNRIYKIDKNLKPGVYIIEVIQGENIKTLKVVKQ